MLLDQSALFDSAWRSYQGQVLYRDYFFPRPPITILIQFLSFVLMGVDFSAMVFPAALFNALGTLCVMWIINHIFPSQRLLACASGLITAVWFQAPFGTLWFEQTGFLFNLLALVALLKAAHSSRTAAAVLRGMAGLSLGLAILSKQNAGLEFLPVAFGVVVLQHREEFRKLLGSALQVAAGIGVVAIILGIWVWAFSSPSGFWYCMVELPLEIAEDRIGLVATLVGLVTLAGTPQSIPELVILLVAYWRLRRRRVLLPGERMAAWLVAGCVYYQALFQLHTSNETINSIPYVGLGFGLSIALLLAANRSEAEASKAKAGGGRLMYATIGGLVFVLAFADGMGVSLRRTVQQFDSQTRFIPISLPGAERLKWGEPTPVSDNLAEPAWLSVRDFLALNEWLTKEDCNFFVFPDSTILYGMHRKVSPQPWVAFIPRHTFLQGEIARVDAAVVDSLKKNDVRVIILERASWMGNYKLINDMPKLRALVLEQSDKVAEFGIYEVWKLRKTLMSGAAE